MVVRNEVLDRYNLEGEARPSRLPLVTPLITIVRSRRRRYTVHGPGTQEHWRCRSCVGLS